MNMQVNTQIVEHTRSAIKNILIIKGDQGTCQGIIILHKEVRRARGGRKPAEVNFERMEDRKNDERMDLK